jgi:hypothetical protein
VAAGGALTSAAGSGARHRLHVANFRGKLLAPGVVFTGLELNAAGRAGADALARRD